MEGKPPERPPTYNQAVYGQSSSTPSPAPAVVYVQSSYSPAPPHAGVHGPTVQPPDIAYLKSPGGIVKIIEAVSRDRPKPVFLVSAVAESGAVTEVQLRP